MKLNQKLIQQLRNGEIAAFNSGTLEQLKEVLKAAFPEDIRPPAGDSKYYSRSTPITYRWKASPFKDKSKPTFKISDFYQAELFTGWAKDDRFLNWMMYFKDDIPMFGISGGGKWYEHSKKLPNYSQDRDNRPATNEEIETTLTKEAKRRGYKGGNTIKGIHGTTHKLPEISSFYYDAEYDTLLTNESYVVYEAGQWAEIIEQPKGKPKTSPIHYTVGGTTYSLNYQELKAEYDNVVAYSDEGFMANLPQIAHLACVVSTLKGLGTQSTIGDQGIIHELIHLMTDPEEPTNDLQEIREKFNRLIQLV